MGALLGHMARTFAARPAPKAPLRVVVPAPVRGLNTRDSLSDMEPGYAVRMVNFFADHGRVKTRRGYAPYARCPTGAAVETLALHLNGTARKLFAAADGRIFEIDDSRYPDEVPSAAPVQSGHVPRGESSWWRTACFNGNTIWVNGIDEPLRYSQDGNWVSHGFQAEANEDGGPIPVLIYSKLTQVIVHHNRLFFVEKNSSDLWYGKLNAVTGGLRKFPLGPVDEQGGNIAAIGSLSMDTGSGPNDQLAIMLERGQVFTYFGTNPDNLDNWRLTGRYQLAPPVGDRPFVQLGGDLVAITEDGLLPLLQFIRGGRERTDLALSDAIAPTIADAVRDSVDVDGNRLPGWQAVFHAPARWLLFNAPKATNSFRQLVMNPVTKAWSQFEGMDARCWLSDGDRLFFGDSGGWIHRADYGGTDNGRPVEGTVRSAYTYCGTAQEKQIRRIRSHVESEVDASRILLGVSADFERFQANLIKGRLSGAGRRWNTSRWGEFAWATGVEHTRNWQVLSAKGAAFAVHLGASTTGLPVVWFSTDLEYSVLLSGSA